MWAAIVHAIGKGSELMLAIGKAFTKTASEKIEKMSKSIRKKIDHFRKTGRPR